MAKRGLKLTRPMTTHQYNLFDGTPPHVSFSETSLNAAKEIKKSVNKLQKLVLQVVSEAEPHGLTREEIERFTGMRANTARPRIRELFLSDRLETRINPETGKTFCRPTSSGRNAEVCFLKSNSSQV